MSDYRKTILPNGIKIVTEHISYVQSFSLGFWFNNGSVDEIEENNGISHFIEHMLFKGTDKRSPKSIAEEIESLGGYLNAFTSKEHTCYYGRGLSRHLVKTFKVLADMVQHSIFKEKEIKKEAAVIVDELLDIEDSPDEYIFDLFENNVYAGTPLGRPIIGTQSNITGFGREDFINYMEENYTCQRLMIVASGNIEHEKIVELAEKYLEYKSAGNAFIRKPMVFSKASDMNIKKEIQQTHIIIGRTTHGFSNPERTKVNVLSHILGEGSSSRLFQRIREQNGITYQINSFLNSFYDISTFGVYFSTNDKSAAKALSLVDKEFEKLMNVKVSEKELNRAKEYIKGSILMGLESTSNRMMRIAQSELYYDRVKSIGEAISEIEAVTSDDIKEAAIMLLQRDNLTTVTISSEEKRKIRKSA